MLDRFAGTSGLADVRRLTESDASEWWRRRKIISAIAGQFAVGGHNLVLRIGLSIGFPLALAEIAIDSCTPPLALPHVSPDGKICFTPEDSVVLDRRDELGILQDCFTLARRTLELGIGPERGAEFLSEIAAVWRELEGGEPRVASVVDATDEPHQIVAFYDQRKLVALAEDQVALGQLFPSRTAARYTNQNAVYVPIDPSTEVAFEPRCLLDLKTFRRLTSGVEGVAEILSRLTKREEIIVLGVRRPTGPRALIAVRALGNGGEHVLARGDAKLTAVSCDRGDREALAPRGGADAALLVAKVLVAGCGSVGGHVAIALARAGVGEVHLVDHEAFELANAYRHVCGMAYNGQSKAEGLAKEIRRLVPHVTVLTRQARIEEILKSEPSFLRQFDLIVSAIGSPTIELHLNESIFSEGGCPALFVWLEPLGIGRHVLLTRPGVAGCLECLWKHDGDGPLRNRAAFAAPGPDYTRDLHGCGSRHVPFTNLDASAVAESAVRLGVEVLSKRATGPVLLSTKGTPDAFFAAGFSVTSRFGVSQERLDDDRALFARTDCPVCAHAQA